MGTCISLISDVFTIITGILAIAAFIGIRDKLSFVKKAKIIKIKKFIKTHKNAEFITFRTVKNAPWLDRDYLIINSKLYWIANAETLDFVCEYNKNAMIHPDKKTNFINENRLKENNMGEILNIQF